MRKIFFLSFLLLIFSLPVLATASPDWRDTVENYPTGSLTDYWASSGAVSVVSYPTASAAHSLAITSSISEGWSSSTAYSTTNDYVFTDYVSFTLRDYVAVGTGVYTRSYSTSLLNSGGQVVATYTATANVPGVYEYVASGNDVYLYRNGVSLGIIDNGFYTEGAACKLRISTYTEGPHSTGYGDPQTTTVYVDDISTGSCVGVAPSWNEYQTAILGSYRIQGLTQYPTSQYTIKLTSLVSETAGVINTTTLSTSSAAGYMSWDVSDTLGSNYGIYIITLSRDNLVLDEDYFVYSQLANPIQYPDLLMLASSNVNMEIRDADNNGGIISGGGSTYLYPDNDSGIYPIFFTLQDVPYSFTATLNAVYGNELINSTPFYFSGLNNNYVVSVDGKSLAGEKASGSLSFFENAADGETVSIGSDTYEFDSGDGVTDNYITVPIGENASLSAENLAQEINSNGTESVSASTEEGVGEFYYSEISIQNNPNIADYQAKVTIPFETGMSTDFSNIRFFDGETSIPYWIESKTDSDSTVVWIPISAGSNIQCRWGLSGETVSESDGYSVFTVFDDFNDYDYTNNVAWSVSDGTWSATSGSLIQTDASSAHAYHSYSHSTDFVYTANIKANACSGLIFDKSTGGYVCRFGAANTVEFENDGVANIQTWEYSWTQGTVYKFTIKHYGDSVSVYINDNLVGTSSSTVYSTGTQIGVTTYQSTTSTFDDVRIRKYAETEPTLSAGSAQATTGGLIFLHVIATQTGSAQNSIETSETCTNAAWESSTLTGGNDGSFILGSSWNYTITDWTNLTTHIFSFSPDLSKPGVYGYIKDTATQAPIKSATVTISTNSSTQYVYTDSTGLYYLTEGMALGETYSVTAAKTGYTQSASFNAKTVAGATTRKDLFMDSLSSGSGIYYAAHDVTFTVLEYWYSAVGLPGVSYSVYDNSSELLKSGTTGSKGTFSVKDMDQGVRYTIVLTYNGNTYTEYIEPGLTEYNLVLNKEGIVHEYYNNWLTLSYVETPGNVSVLFNSNKTITAASLTVTASNGTIVQADTLNSTSGTFSFNFTDGDYTLQFNIEASDGSTAAQVWAISYPSQVTLFPASYPAWLKNTLFVAIITIFLLAFGKSKNDIACGSVAVLTSLGYYFEWLTCSFNFVVLIWIIALGAIFLHYKRTGAVG